MIYRMCIERAIAKSEAEAMEQLAPDLTRRSLLPEDFEISSGLTPYDLLQTVEDTLSPSRVDVRLEELQNNADFHSAFRALGRAMGLRGKLQRFKSSFSRRDMQASLSFEYEGKYYQSSWRLDRPWVNEELLKLMNSAFSKSTGKELVAMDTEGGPLNVYTAARGSTRLIGEVAECASIRTDPEIAKGGKMVASGVISVTGLALTFLIAWFFLGLTQAAIVATAIWLVFFAVAFTAHSLAARRKQTDEFEEDFESAGLAM